MAKFFTIFLYLQREFLFSICKMIIRFFGNELGCCLRRANIEVGFGKYSLIFLYIRSSFHYLNYTLIFKTQSRLANANIKNLTKVINMYGNDTFNPVKLIYKVQSLGCVNKHSQANKNSTQLRLKPQSPFYKTWSKGFLMGP